MTDVALLKINRFASISSSPPLGLLYLSSALKSADFSSKIYHIDPSEIDETVSEIIAAQPLWVGFSVFTGDCITECLAMSGMLHEANIPIIWGNAHPTLMPNDCLGEEAIDACVLSEGEETVIDISNALKRKQWFHDIPGVVFRDRDNQIVHNGSRPFMKSIDKYGPDWDAVDVERYIVPYGHGRDRSLGIVASRGCPYSCGFCYNEAFNDRKWRRHSPEYIESMVKSLARKYKIDSIRFLDDYFFASKRWAFEVIRRIDMPWRGSFYLNDVNDDFLRNLQNTQCYEVFFGLESGSDRILDLIGKQFTSQEIYEGVVRLSKVSGMRISASAIFGYPTETEQEFRETLQLLVKLMREIPGVNYTLGWYMPYPGTPLWGATLKGGFKPPETLAGWDMLDRWSPTLEKIEWIEWGDIEEFTKLRKYFQVAGVLRRLKVPFLAEKVLRILETRGYRTSRLNKLLMESLVRMRSFLLYGKGKRFGAAFRHMRVVPQASDALMGHATDQIEATDELENVQRNVADAA